MTYSGDRFEHNGYVYQYIDPYCVKVTEKGKSNWSFFDTAIGIERKAMIGHEYYKVIAKGLGLQYERKE